jgi:hypothetical protein
MMDGQPVHSEILEVRCAFSEDGDTLAQMRSYGRTRAGFA